MKERQIKFIADVKQYYDKANGNPYFSARVIRCEDGKTFYLPYEWGGDSLAEQRVLIALIDNGFVRGYNEKNYYAIQREKNYPVYFTYSNVTRKECMSHGRE